MPETYFLGANSHKGFYSLYEHFAAGEGDFLHIIKGGPGTGKSGFMRKMAEAAEKKGYRCERLLCSGDPDSLDGLYIPELKTGWVDGTAPHAGEPRAFGVNGDYVNIGQFCRPIGEPERGRVEQLYTAYRQQYRQAYDFLAGAARLRSAAVPNVWNDGLISAAEKRIGGILRRRAQSRSQAAAAVRHCFMSAISCKGRISLKESVNQLCKQIYVLDNVFRGGEMLLPRCAEAAGAMGLEHIICHDPLEPEKPEGIIIPEAGLGFFTGSFDGESSRHIRLDGMLPQTVCREHRSAMRRAEKLYEGAMEQAVERLKEAKRLHDELESCYKLCMDFEALTEFTEKEAKRIFG